MEASSETATGQGVVVMNICGDVDSFAAPALKGRLSRLHRLRRR